MAKNQTVLACLRQFFNDTYVRKHPNESWPDGLQGGLGVVVRKDAVTNPRYFFMDHTLIDESGVEYVVCNQWGKDNFQRFIEHAERMGYPLESNQNLVGDADIVLNNSNDEIIQLNINSSFTADQYLENFNRCKKYVWESNEPMRLVVKCGGRLSQILLCIKEPEIEIEDIEDHNSFHYYYKLDADNYFEVELNGVAIFKGTAGDLKISAEYVTYLDWMASENGTEDDLRTRIKLLKEVPKSDLEYTTTDKALLRVTDIDEDGWEDLYLTESNLLVLQKSFDEKLSKEFDYSQRYCVEYYGKFQLESYAVMVNDFKLSDLIFLQHSSLEDLTKSAYPYCFSEILHKSQGELELFSDNFDVKDTDTYEGWPRDY